MVVLCGALALAATASTPRAQESEYLTVRLGGNETIREIAQQYLGDPDLWSEILRASGLRSITELRPGLELKVPANAVSMANKALIDANGQIQAANLAGAQLFAIDNIGRAIQLHDAALVRRVKSDWSGTRTLATESYGEATIAIEKSQAARDQSAEALVTDRHGNVEGQRPQDLGWRGLELQSRLVEEERVRTLSDSTAQITFRDASRLRLNANSNAVIQRLRFDPLRRSEEAKVSLVDGDFYALLASPSTRASFNVELPRVNASIDSGNFWVRNDQDGARFANYDDGAVQVTAAGESVTLGRNEGTVVRAGAAPGEKLSVLPPPQLSGPGNEATVYNRPPQLAWSAVPNAVGYWIEIGRDQAFSRMVLSRFGIEQPGFDPSSLSPGEYYWRVAALDSFGLPGARSEIWRFAIVVDTEPPFLTIRSPERGAILRGGAVIVAGESEPGASVTVQGKPVSLTPGGAFEVTIEAAPGENTVTVVATDPAGNETRHEREFIYMPDRKSVVEFDAGIPRIGTDHFLSAVDTLSLGGTTTANARILIREGGHNIASASTDAQGRFRLNVPLKAGTAAYQAEVVAPSGFSSTAPFSVTVDPAVPDIVLDRPLPRLTAESTLLLQGKTKPGATLILNGREIENRNGRFEAPIDLRQGMNSIELTASDAAGNSKTERWQVQADREPPQLIASRVTPAPGGRAALIVEVEARDDSGLAVVAPVTIVAGERRITGHLRFNRATGTYRGTIVAPADTLASAALREVELADDAGNRRTFQLQ